MLGVRTGLLTQALELVFVATVQPPAANISIYHTSPNPVKTHLRRLILDRKPGPSTSHNQIERVFAIRPLPDDSLDFEVVVGYDLGASNFPLVPAILLKCIFEG